MRTKERPPRSERRQAWDRLTGRTPARDERERRRSFAFNALVLLAGCFLLELWTFWFAAAGADRGAAILSYLAHPALMALNYLPILILALFFAPLFGRLGRGFVCGGTIVMILTLISTVKMALRNDPFCFADFMCAGEAGGVVGRYSLGFTAADIALIVCGAALLFLVAALAGLRLPPWRGGGWTRRLAVMGVSACLGVSAFFGLYLSNDIYNSAAASNFTAFSQWSLRGSYQARGFLYPFLHTGRQMFSYSPEGYDETSAAETLSSYTDADIPADTKVNVVGIQLESFCDFSQYVDLPGVEEAYAPLHEIEKNAVVGSLVTNIFAGGTSDTERCFLTGMTTYGSLSGPTNSYVYYFNRQGYATLGSTPGYQWFYNRQNVMRYLGFPTYWFTENRYGTMVDAETAYERSDGILFPDIYTLLCGAKSGGTPCFSFSVSTQNHGPYTSDALVGEERVTAEETGWSETDCIIFNNYLDGAADTSEELLKLTETLESDSDPIVLVFFGDHKPWLGNECSVYKAMGLDMDTGTTRGYVNYYSTQYVIWANSAAKKALGSSVSGTGPAVSPNFLMTELFDVLGWEGPAYMQANRAVMAQIPVISNGDACIVNGALTYAPQGAAAALVSQFRDLEYYWQQNFLYG